jgi:hypothetical protein
MFSCSPYVIVTALFDLLLSLVKLSDEDVKLSVCFVTLLSLLRLWSTCFLDPN